MTIPTRAPIYTILCLIGGLLLAFGIGRAWLQFCATPMQRLYLTKPGLFLYVRTALPRFHLGLAKPEPWWVRTYLRGGKEYLDPVGSVQGRWTRILKDRKELHEMLAEQVYGGGIYEAARHEVWAACGIVFAAVFGGAILDERRRKRIFIDGIRVRGPELLTRRQFNRRRKGDGFRLEVV